jgi:superfamily II DNA or RNA helicase
MELRSYQKEALKALKNDFISNDKLLLCLATGGGKTLTAASFIKQNWWGKIPVIWVAHNEQLLRQAYDAFSLVGIDTVKYWKSKEKFPLSEVNNKTIILTMIQSARSLDWPNIPVNIVVDETHRDAAISYKNLYTKLNPCKKLGLSATPFRLDNKKLDYDKISYSKSLLELIKLGYLAKPIYERVSTNITVANSNVVNKEFSKEFLSNLCIHPERINFVVNFYIKNKNYYKKTILFAPNISIANEYKKQFENNGISVACVHGRLPKNITDTYLKLFSEGSVDILINIQMFVDGYDEPSINSVFLTTPTLSKVKYTQCIGRGARKTKGKNRFYVVDFVDNMSLYEDMSSIYANDLLGVEIPKVLRDKIEKEKKEKKKKEELKKLNITGDVSLIVAAFKLNEKKTVGITENELNLLKTASFIIKNLIPLGPKAVNSFIYTAYYRARKPITIGKSSLWVSLLKCIYKQYKNKNFKVSITYFELVFSKIDLSLYSFEKLFSREEAEDIFNKFKVKGTSFLGIHYNVIFVDIAGTGVSPFITLSILRKKAKKINENIKVIYLKNVEQHQIKYNANLHLSNKEYFSYIDEK